MAREAAADGSRGAASAPGARRVCDVMRRDFITVSKDETLLEAFQLMRLARLRHLAVVSDGLLVGVLSYRDLQDELLSRFDPSAAAPGVRGLERLRVAECMAESPFSIVPNATLFEAASRIERLRVGCLPVAEPAEQGLRLVGILTEMDLLRAAFAP